MLGSLALTTAVIFIPGINSAFGFANPDGSAIINAVEYFSAHGSCLFDNSSCGNSEDNNACRAKTQNRKETVADGAKITLFRQDVKHKAAQTQLQHL